MKALDEMLEVSISLDYLSDGFYGDNVLCMKCSIASFAVGGSSNVLQIVHTLLDNSSCFVHFLLFYMQHEVLSNWNSRQKACQKCVNSSL